MYPWYTTGEMGNVELSKDDKRGIRALYGTFKLGTRLNKLETLQEQ